MTLSTFTKFIILRQKYSENKNARLDINAIIRVLSNIFLSTHITLRHEEDLKKFVR